MQADRDRHHRRPKGTPVRQKKKKILLTSLIYYRRSLILVPRPQKLGIRAHSTIKTIYFWPLGCFGGWFSRDSAATRYMRSPSYEIYLFQVPRLF